ncbi:MAG TPA: Gfo/Idh/MocA family oxidoreductase [Tepidisphaeraceae bacterium]|nr:Gfo/Idh/MocA family oxidoreductase [Tepidisphaeraceae bacterium]
MNSTVNVALVGISGYGESYVKALLDSPADAGFRIVGMVDPMPERCRRLEEITGKRRIPIHADLEALYDATPAKIDLVMMATPIHLHAPHTCFALARGSSVLCEKPVGATVDDALRMLEAEHRADGFAAIGFQWSFSRAIQALKRDVIAGEFGAPVRLKTIACFPRSMQYFQRNDWAGKVRTADGTPVFDSPVNNATAHYLHNMLYLLGPTRQTSAAPTSVQAELYRANAIENYDTAAVRVVVEGGAELLFYTSHAVPIAMGPVLCYEFERATVYYEAETGGGFVARFRNGAVRRYGDPNTDRPLKIWQCIDAVRTGEEIACGIPAAVPHALCVAAAAASMPNVNEFPSDLITTQGLSGQPMKCVTGLASAMVQCYDQGILPAEHRGLTWSTRGERIDLTQPDWQHDGASRRAVPLQINVNGNGHTGNGNGHGGNGNTGNDRASTPTGAHA